LFSSDVIHHLVEQHLSRRANLGYHLWGLLTLHLWIHRWKIETQTTSELEHGAVIGSAAG
jgi:asparagine synthase (glutamine-hydrolysing)